MAQEVPFAIDRASASHLLLEGLDDIGQTLAAHGDAIDRFEARQRAAVAMDPGHRRAPFSPEDA